MKNGRPLRAVVLLALVCVLVVHVQAQTTDTTQTAITTATAISPVIDSASKVSAINDTVTNTSKPSGKIFKSKKHSVLKAALFSAAVPGLGQAYNKRYWKIPIVYAGFAGLGYAVYYTASNFNGYRNAYRLQVDGDNSTYGSYKGVDDAPTLKSYRDYFKRNLDISAICMAVWYALNIVDATVDAHLFDWNMSDDLTMRVEPIFFQPSMGMQASAGIKFGFHF